MSCFASESRHCNLSSMELEFTKMHGLGNDFIILNGLQRSLRLTRDQIRLLADRHFGVGCDQLLLIEAAAGADIRYRIFNADGEEAQQCGNGARCIADFLRRESIITKDVITAETARGVIRIHALADGNYRVDMGAPEFEPAAIPMLADGRSERYTLALPGGTVEIYALSMGNPHAVLEVGDVETAAVETLGPQIQQHSVFPEGVNVGFMQILDGSHIRLRVYERGAGETLACGSGACAAVAAGRMAGRLDNQVNVGLKGGHLLITWEGEGAPVWMSGPAVMVFKGRIEI
jgi:diaminopimelate epimerase